LKLRVFCSCAMLMASFVIGSAPGTGTLRGIVRDPEGAVIPRAAVSIQHWRVERGVPETLLASR